MDAAWKRGRPLPVIQWTGAQGSQGARESAQESSIYRWRVSPGSTVDKAWLCWSPGNIMTDSARYWVQLPARQEADGAFSVTLPDAWRRSAAWLYPLVEFADGYALSGDLEIRAGAEPGDNPGEWSNHAIWDLERGAGAWRPLGGSPGERIDIAENGDIILVTPQDAGGQFAALTNSVGWASAAARHAGGIAIIIDGQGTPGQASVILVRNTGSLDQQSTEAVFSYEAGRKQYVIPWSEFHPGARWGEFRPDINGSFKPDTQWWDGLVIKGQRPKGKALGIGAIRWASAKQD
jgi:hypothetical protein